MAGRWEPHRYLEALMGWDWKKSAKKAATTLGLAALAAVAAVIADPNTRDIVGASGAPAWALTAFALVAAGARFVQDWLKNR